MTKSLTFSILFSTVVRAAVVAKLVTLGISPLTSFILALRVAIVAELVISSILSSIFLIFLILSTPVASLKSAFVALLDRSNSTFTFAPKDFGFLFYQSNFK